MRAAERNSTNRRDATDDRRRGPRSSWAAALAAAVASLAVASGAVAAHRATLTVNSSHNTTLAQTIVVSHGRTLYRLKPETTRHLLCKTTACLGIWKPLTVRSASTRLKDGTGVTGKLGILHRTDGTLQVTLRGLPVYRFVLDHNKAGAVNGQHIHSFGGTWEVVAAKTSQKKPATPPVGTYTYPTGTTGY